MDVVCSLFRGGRVCTLEDYVRLDEKKGEEGKGSDEITKKESSSSFRSFLRTRTIAIPRDAPPLPPRSEPTYSQADTVHRVIETLFKFAWPEDPMHILTKGFRRSRPGHGSASGTGGAYGVSSYCPNPFVSRLKENHWTTLLNTVGNAQMIHMLLYCYLFRREGGGKVYQISGRPVQYLVYEDSLAKAVGRKRGGSKKAAASSVPRRTKKRQRCDDGCRRERAYVSRHRILFSDSFGKRPGLGQKHVLNRLLAKESTIGTMTCASQLARDVFRVLRTRNDKKNEGDTTGAPKSKRRKTILHWRIRDSAPGLMRKVLVGHRKCRYDRLLQKCCPLPKALREMSLSRRVLSQITLTDTYASQGGADDDDDDDEEEEEERVEGRVTAVVARDEAIAVDSTTTQSPSGDVTDVSALLSCTTPPSSVANFLVAALTRVLPWGLWGSGRNRSVLAHKIESFVAAGRHCEAFSDVELMTGVTIGDFTWIRTGPRRRKKKKRVAEENPESRQQRRRHTNPTEHRLCSDLVRRWIVWMFSELVVPLIRANFYVTESEANSQTLVYYRKPVWARICRRTMFDLVDASSETSLLRPLRASKARAMFNDKNESSSKRSRLFGCALLRLVPKMRKGDVRPIMNLSSRTRAAHPVRYGSSILSVNACLADTFAVLDSERRRRPQIVGSSVYDLNEIHVRFRKFAKKIKLRRSRRAGREERERTNVFFVVADVSHCFDSINQRKLLHIIREVALVDREYVVRSFATVRRGVSSAYRRGGGGHDDDDDGGCRLSTRKCRIASVCSAAATNDEGSTTSGCAANELSQRGGTKRSVIVDGVVQKYLKRRSVLELIRGHVTRNVVRMGNRYFTQRRGIPQGSVLSTVLCNIYYGWVERVLLKLEGHEGKDWTLMRLTDDFLFLSTSRDLATEFARKVRRGAPEYGFRTNPKKMRTNFDVPLQTENGRPLENDDGSTEEKSPWITWCGVRIHRATIEIAVDYSKFLSTTVVAAVAKGAETRRQQSLNRFSHVLMAFLARKCHAIFLDSTLNSFARVSENVIILSVLSAIKFRRFVRSLPVRPKAQERVEFVSKTAKDFSALVRERSDVVLVSSADVEWLFLTAFARVLRRGERVEGGGENGSLTSRACPSRSRRRETLASAGDISSQ
eukprot:g1259.t1